MERVNKTSEVLSDEEMIIEVKQNNLMNSSTESFEDIEHPKVEVFTNVDIEGNEVNEETNPLPEPEVVETKNTDQHPVVVEVENKHKQPLGVSVLVDDIDLDEFGITADDIQGNHLEIIEIYNDNPNLKYKILHDIRKEQGGKRKVLKKWRSKPKPVEGSTNSKQQIHNNVAVLESEAASHNKLVHSENGNPDAEPTSMEDAQDASAQESGITGSHVHVTSQPSIPSTSAPAGQSTAKTVTPGGASDTIILSMLYLDPIKSAAPIRSQKLPLLTESYNRNAQGYASASPITWTEGLSVLALDTSGTSRCVDVLEGIQTMVGSGKRCPLPPKSTVGIQITELTGQSLGATGMRAFMSPANTLDIMSVTSLLEIARNEGEVWSPPEDIFLRMNLLRMSLVKPSWYIHNTNVHRRMAMNAKMTHIKPEDDKWSMLTPPETSDPTKCVIGSKAGEVNCVLLTLTQYLKCVVLGTGGFLPNTVLKITIPTDHIVIPISSNDLKKPVSWMIPYIIAHTTTHWYNMALSFNTTITPVKTATANAYLKMMVMNKASTVEVHKSTKSIVFVVVDSADQTFDTTRCLLITKDYKDRIKNDGAIYTGLPKLVHTWLGRTGTKFGDHDTDCAMAARRICEYYNCQGLKKRCESMAVEMTMKVFMPFSCSQPEVECSEIVELHGPTAYNDTVTIGACSLKKWDTEYDGTTAPKRINALNDWSVSPYGLFPSAHFKVEFEDMSSTNKTEKKYKGFKDWENMSAAYNISSTSAIDTLLLAIGIYIRDPDCNNDTFETNIFFANEIRARSVLVHAVLTNILVNAGLTLADWNFWDYEQYDMPPDIFRILPGVTAGFIRATNETYGGRIIEDETWRTNIKDLMGFAGVNDVQTFYYMPFPIWFVRDVMNKFTKSFQDMKFPPLAIMCGYGDSASIYDKRPGGFMGWRFVRGDDTMAFNMLVATTNYEVDAMAGGKGFAVFTPNSNYSIPERKAIGWNPYLFNDRLLYLESTTSSNTFFEKTYKKLYDDGVILTTSVTLPLQTSLVKYAPIQFGVSSKSHTNPTVQRSLIKNLGELKWPDPFLEWLLRGIKDVGMTFLDKGPTSALIHTISHIAEPIVSWVDQWERNNWGSQPASTGAGTFRA